MDSNLKRTSKTPIPEREHQVLELAAAGLTDKEIAASLNISTETVNTYWRRIRQRFGAANRAEVVALAVRERSEGELESFAKEREQLLFEIAQRKRAEALAKTSEARWLSLLANAPDIISHCTADGVILFTNSDSPDEAPSTGSSIFDLATGQNSSNRELLSEAFRRAVEVQEVQSLEMKYVFADKRIGWYHVRVAPIVGQNPPEVVLFSTRITEKKEQELALQRSEALYEEAQQIAGIGNWQYDLSTEKIWWSREVYRIFGRSVEFGPPTYAEQMEMVHPEDRGIWDSHVIPAIKSGIPFVFIHRAVLPSGEIRFLQCRGQCTRSDSGKPISIHGTVQDVSELQAFERKLATYAQQRHELIAIAKELSVLKDANDLDSQLERLLSKLLTIKNLGLLLYDGPHGSPMWVDGSGRTLKESISAKATDSTQLFSDSETASSRVFRVQLMQGEAPFGCLMVSRDADDRPFDDQEKELIELFALFAAQTCLRLNPQ